ncbi:hypothetical protein ACJIZ3_022295 [Penstemon smallii]|uniref:MBD domain-containing protein n=1 Tax=Penstemon smallii TaxID=265156 RepID=A0ABD3TKX2_9LAMI
MGEQVEHPDWLPQDWKVSVKLRSYGRKDKLYINPSNGLKFNSKLEVLRYLKSWGENLKDKELNKSQILQIDIKRTAAENLPPGWIKETRTKKKGYKTRRDPCYIDPVSGRHFRSRQEVFRYLETKGSGKSNQDKKDHSQSSSAEAKGHMLTHKNTDNTFMTVRKSQKSGATTKYNVTMREDKDNDDVKQREAVEEDDGDSDLAIELANRLKLVVNTTTIDIRPPDDGRSEQKIERLLNNKRKKSNSSKGLPHSKRLALSSGEEHKVIGGLGSNEDEKHGEELDESSLQEILLMDPCIEFAIKTLTGAIPIEEINKVFFHSNSTTSTPLALTPTENDG